jgi:hypothetical protein
VASDVAQPQRLGVVDQLAEHPTPARGITDALALRVAETGRDEALEACARRVEHAERRVASTGQLARCVEHPRKYRIEVELVRERRAELDQAFQSPNVQDLSASLLAKMQSRPLQMRLGKRAGIRGYYGYGAVPAADFTRRGDAYFSGRVSG